MSGNHDYCDLHNERGPCKWCDIPEPGAVLNVGEDTRAPSVSATPPPTGATPSPVAPAPEIEGLRDLIMDESKAGQPAAQEGEG